MTVKELKKVLKHCDDDDEVVVEYTPVKNQKEDACDVYIGAEIVRCVKVKKRVHEWHF